MNLNFYLFDFYLFFYFSFMICSISILYVWLNFLLFSLSLFFTLYFFHFLMIVRLRIEWWWIVLLIFKTFAESRDSSKMDCYICGCRGDHPVQSLPMRYCINEMIMMIQRGSFLLLQSLQLCFLLLNGLRYDLQYVVILSIVLIVSEWIHIFLNLRYIMLRSSFPLTS